MQEHQCWEHRMQEHQCCWEHGMQGHQCWDHQSKEHVLEVVGYGHVLAVVDWLQVVARNRYSHASVRVPPNNNNGILISVHHVSGICGNKQKHNQLLYTASRKNINGVTAYQFNSIQFVINITLKSMNIFLQCASYQIKKNKKKIVKLKGGTMKRKTGPNTQ